MTKISRFLTTLVALFAMTAGAWAENPKVKYALTSGLTISSGTTVEVKDGTDVVATITYSETGGNNFTTKTTSSTSALDGYTAFTEGNGTNGEQTGGTFYTIVPAYDGTIDVAVVLNADKQFYILEDGTALEGYNGMTVTSKYYGTYSFAVKAGKSYKIYAYNSKLGFYGFEYTYTAPTGTALKPDATRKVWTLDAMPAGNVELEPEYYPQAEFAMSTDERPRAHVPAPTDAIIFATTDEPLVSPGRVADIPGSTDGKKQGTVMFYVGTTDNLTEDQLIALVNEGKWSADVPTAADINEACEVYVYYYIKGNDSDTDEENFSDGDFCSNPVHVTIGDAPTYSVTFADGVNPAEPAQPEWTATPNTDVKRGQTVTVTYSGDRKVIGVKAEKKAAPKLLEFEPGGKKFYYYEGETWKQAIDNHPENAANGWRIDEDDETVYNNNSELKGKDHDDEVYGNSLVDATISYIWYNH